MHAIEDRLGHPDVPDGEHEQMLAPLQRPAGSLPAARRLQHRPEDRDRAARPRLRRRPTYERPTETFSGGWQMRIALAKLLLAQPEPAAARRADQPPRPRRAQLARGVPARLPARRHPRLARPLLPRRRRRRGSPRSTCGRSNDYPGNYSHYLEREPGAGSSGCARPSASRTTRSRGCEMFIDRFRYQATKAAQVQSRIKMLEKIVPIEVPPERKRVHFTFPTCGQERADGARAEARAQGVRRERGLPRHRPPHRARRPHRRSSGRTAPASRR